jgi:hypothetical protein
MVYAHYQKHQPEHDTNILGWILLAICASFLAGMIVRGTSPPVVMVPSLTSGASRPVVMTPLTSGASRPVVMTQSLQSGAPTENARPNADMPTSLGTTGLPTLLW